MILRHDRSDRDSVIKESAWPAFTTFFNGRGGASLIAPRWLLTAAHVATHVTPGRTSVELAGTRCSVSRAIAHPSYDAAWVATHEDDEDDEDAPDSHPVVDLALVELAAPVTGVTPFSLYEDANEQGREALLLGCGEFGDGLRGARGFDRGLRQATNLVDAVDPCWLMMRFTRPQTAPGSRARAGGAIAAAQPSSSATGAACSRALAPGRAWVDGPSAPMARWTTTRASRHTSGGYGRPSARKKRRGTAKPTNHPAPT